MRVIRIAVEDEFKGKLIRKEHVIDTASLLYMRFTPSEYFEYQLEKMNEEIDIIMKKEKEKYEG